MADSNGYSMVSVPKQGSNPGMPRGKKNIVVIFDFDKATMVRDEKGVTVRPSTAATRWRVMPTLAASSIM